MSDTPTGRKPIPKSIRFEVFKRDSFKCQYCGAVAPDVLLQVDHIRPVADGGTNDITNLITSCEPCNNGKRDRVLSENTAVSKSRNQLELLQERREQLELMMEWQRGLADLKDEVAEKVSEFWNDVTWSQSQLTPTGLAELHRLISKFSAEEVIRAIVVAKEAYFEFEDMPFPTHQSACLAWSKIGGICRVERLSKEKPYIKDLYYLRGILRRRLPNYYDNVKALKYLENTFSWGVSIEELGEIVRTARNWSNFVELLEYAIAAAKARRGST